MSGSDQVVTIVIDRGELHGDLQVPADARGIVLFAHGSGSSRLSPRNRAVAAYLRKQGLGTLLFDLLTAQEARVDDVTREYRFDIGLLAPRLAAATHWLAERRPGEAVGYFGASTGAAAALLAAAKAPDAVRAVVSRGGRPDLAGAALASVRAPTLLIVGGDDPEVMRLNAGALEQMRCEKELVVIPGATHLFEEPGTMEEVARFAADWFVRHLSPPTDDRSRGPRGRR